METTLFKWGKFKAHSGKLLNWKIDCDALSDTDIQCAAKLIADKVGKFELVYGIPRGGKRLSAALVDYELTEHEPIRTVLIVDDVLTSGGSMEKEKEDFQYLAKKQGQEWDIKGFVIFARGKCPKWITPMLQVAI